MALINSGFANNYASAVYTWLTAMTPEKTITITKIGTSAKHTASSASLAARIYNSAGQLVASSPVHTCYPNQYTMMQLDIAVTIEAGETYYVGFYGSNHSVYTAGTKLSMTDVDLTIAFGETRYHGADNFPTSISGVSPHGIQLEYIVGTMTRKEFVNTNSGSTGSIQSWVVPTSGVYRIKAMGARGGLPSGVADSYRGRGASIEGSVSLLKGQIIKIVVGQEGRINTGGNPSNGGGAGGGGTFVWVDGQATPLMVAGGGGGASITNTSGASTQERTKGRGGTYGRDGTDSWGENLNNHGVDGANATYSNGARGWKNMRAGLNFNGISGGGYGAAGGYGGGGLDASLNHAGGGGGGYSGGGGGYFGNNYGGNPDGRDGGGGGGSYNGGVDQANYAGANDGQGSVVITSTILTPKIVQVTTDKKSVLSGDAIKVSWAMSAYNDQFADTTFFKVELRDSTGWREIVRDIKEQEYTYVIPRDTKLSIDAIFRITCKFDNNGVTGIYDDPLLSSTFTINKFMSLVKSNGKLFTYKNPDWIEILSVQDKELFNSQGLNDLDLIPESKWDELSSPVSIVSFTNSSTTPVVDVTVPSYKPVYLLEQGKGDLTVRSAAPSDIDVHLSRVANPHGQLIVQKEDITLNAPTIPRIIRKITFKGATIGSPSSNRKVVLSVDNGKSFYTWKNSQWEIISEVSKEVVQVDGMTIEEVNARTEEDWYEIFKDKPRQVRFAYYLEMNLFSDQLTIDEVEFLMDITGSWRKASKEEYEYAYPNDEVLQIELFKDGYYKINY